MGFAGKTPKAPKATGGLGSMAKGNVGKAAGGKALLGGNHSSSKTKPLKLDLENSGLRAKALTTEAKTGGLTLSDGHTVYPKQHLGWVEWKNVNGDKLTDAQTRELSKMRAQALGLNDSYLEMPAKLSRAKRSRPSEE